MLAIVSTADELLDQAGITTSAYMAKGKSTIDSMFGEGYAAQHPELLAAFMEVAARDFDTAIWAKATLQTMGQMAEALDRISDSLLK